MFRDDGRVSTPLKALIATAALDAAAVLLPVACGGCGAPDRSLCATCRTALGAQLVRRRLDSGLVVVAGLPYAGVARRCILALKEEGRTDLARSLATPLTAAIVEALEAQVRDQAGAGGIRLCPVPQGPSSWRRRGVDPVRMLARLATGRPIERMLRRDATGGAQKLLGVEERRSNIAGTLRSRHPLDGVPVLLLDDVVTTGATLDEAARAVRQAGGEVVGAVAVAATPRHTDTRDGAS